jgi:hypothetical protein
VVKDLLRRIRRASQVPRTFLDYYSEEGNN